MRVSNCLFLSSFRLFSFTNNFELRILLGTAFLNQTKHYRFLYRLYSMLLVTLRMFFIQLMIWIINITNIVRLT